MYNSCKIFIQLVLFNYFISHGNSKGFHGMSVSVVVGTDHLVEVIHYVFIHVHHISDIQIIQSQHSILQYMIEDDDFNDYESAADQHRHNFTENIAENRAEATIQMGLLDDYSSTIKQPFLQRFFSLGSLPPTSSPFNFNELLKDKSIDAYSIKKDNTIDATEPTNFINFTRHGSEQHGNNVSNLTYEFNSFAIEPNITKSQLDLSLVGGQTSVNYQFQPSKQQPSTINSYVFESISQNIGTIQNNVKLQDHKQINFQNVSSNPKYDYVGLVQTPNLNIQIDSFINFDLSANTPNQFIQVLQNNLQSTNKNQNDILGFDAKLPQSLGAEVIQGKERTDSDEFEFIQAENSDAVHIQGELMKAANSQEQEVWPSFMNKNVQSVQDSSILISEKEPKQIIQNELNENETYMDYGFLQTYSVQTKANAVTLQTQYDEDQFVFGQHTQHNQQSKSRQQKPIQNQSSHLQQQDDEEFGDFSHTNSQQSNHEVQYNYNSSNSNNLVAIIAQSESASYSLSKQKQLQSFLDSLPDYSQVFASAQLS